MKADLSKVENKQAKTVRLALIWSVFAILFIVLPFYGGNPLSDLWGISFIALFILISCLVVAAVYQSRSVKMKNLLNRTELLANWQLDREMKNRYIAEMSRELHSRSKTLLWVMSGFFLLFTVFFLSILEDNRPVFLMIMGSAYTLIFASAKFFPSHYIRKNKRGDGLVLIGSKYAYINGDFHNWDFPLSGLSGIQPISEPFSGIGLVYYYTVRNSVQTQELRIPVPETIDSEKLIAQIQTENK
jgi:hypothetical protein